MENTAKHTATPWQTVTLDGDVYLQMGNGEKKNSGCGLLAKIGEPLGADRKANAEFIVKAVNNHEQLIESMRNILNGLYAFRDSKQENGMKAEVEQRLINIGIEAINQATK